MAKDVSTTKAKQTLERSASNDVTAKKNAPQRDREPNAEETIDQAGPQREMPHPNASQG